MTPPARAASTATPMGNGMTNVLLDDFSKSGVSARRRRDGEEQGLHRLSDLRAQGAALRAHERLNGDAQVVDGGSGRQTTDGAEHSVDVREQRSDLARKSGAQRRVRIRLPAAAIQERLP